jgi:hypothetical protein
MRGQSSKLDHGDQRHQADRERRADERHERRRFT